MIVATLINESRVEVVDSERGLLGYINVNGRKIVSMPQVSGDLVSFVVTYSGMRLMYTYNGRNQAFVSSIGLQS